MAWLTMSADVFSLLISLPRRLLSLVRHRGVHPVLRFLRDILNGKALSDFRAARRRRASDSKLAGFSRPTNNALVQGRIVVDGIWDNPNYWLRYALLRRSLGFSPGQEIGLLGPSRSKQCRQTFAALGFKEIHACGNARVALHHRRLADGLLKASQAAKDILAWKLPADFPAGILYDSILKRQRRAIVDLEDKNLPQVLAQALAHIEQIQSFLETQKPDLAVVSHANTLLSGGLAWCARQMDVPTINLQGDFGVSRFVKLGKGETYFDYFDRPAADALTGLSNERIGQLAAVGHDFITARRQGATKDLAAEHAFFRKSWRPTRSQLCNEFGWSEQKPLVCIYASNFFDWPHGFGMTQFRDMLDWLEVTLETITKVTSVNWLLKAHPVEFWYGGLTLEDIMRRNETLHVRLAPSAMHGAAVHDMIDAAVVLHSSAGIEVAALGKPLLVAERGWFHDYPFATHPESRQAYIDALQTPWWIGGDQKHKKNLALAFAGTYFGCPDWQRDFLLAHDSRQDLLYQDYSRLMASGAAEKECDELAAWFASPAKCFHTFKMSRAQHIMAIPV